MTDWAEWLIDNWLLVITPMLVFLGSMILGIWLRRFAYGIFDRWTTKLKWQGKQLTIDITRPAFLHWFLLLGTYIAVQVSILSRVGKDIAGSVIGSLFVLSLFWIIIRLSEKLIILYMSKINVLKSPTTIAVNIIRITLIVVGLLILLEIWGVPTTPIILVLGAAIFITILVFRDHFPTLVSGAQIAWGRGIKVGDFIKLESGEAGHVTDINWMNTQLKTLEGTAVFIPNRNLTHTKISNYGFPLKKASKPFKFFTHVHLKELTGLRAASLGELVSTLKKVPDSVIYYHTHRFLEEHHYLTPEPANDFALWVRDVIGDEVLGERLASIDIFDFPDLEALKIRLAEIIEDYLTKKGDGRSAPEGMELHFIRSISFILPTPYIAYDLREFVEVMKKITTDSFYFHVFDARLRLRKSTNDFSAWIETSLGEKELAYRISRLDPYLYTLDNLRSTVIQIIEQHIK